MLLGAAAGVFTLLLLLLVLSLLSGKADPTNSQSQQPEEPPKEIINSLGMKLVYIRPGTFKMGSPDGEPGHREDEFQHEVEITQPFYMAATDVTVGQFREFVKAKGYQTTAETSGGAEVFTPGQADWHHDPKASWQNPGFKQSDRDPVVCVTRTDAVYFCDWLTTKEVSGAALAPERKYALPTEAQWEYACRAGMQTPYSFGGEPDVLHCWINSNSVWRTHPVGELRPNVWGLSDMHGNVWQWTADWYDAGYYKISPRRDPPAERRRHPRDSRR